MTGWMKRKEQLAGEIEEHIALEAQQNIEAGMTPEAARQAALRKFGNVLVSRDKSRAVWGWLWLEQLLQDIRYAMRSMGKSPGFTVVALLSLMLGIGASVALFSVVYGALIAPFPYANPHQIWWPSTAANEDPMRVWGLYHQYTVKEFQELEKSRIFAGVWAMLPEPDLLTGNDMDTESVTGVRITGEAFNDLGVPPFMGRTIQPFDTHANGEPAQVVVLTYKFWKRVFAGDPHVLGRQLSVNHVPYTVIGVMPDRFGFWTGDTFWMPMRMDLADTQGIFIAVRSRPGTQKRVLEQQLDQFDREMAAITPAHFPKGEIHAILTSLMDDSLANFGMHQSLNLLLGAVGLLLLIACVNVANLQLARTTTRMREIAMRVAIGAGRGRLIRQLLTESVLLSLTGGVLGVLMAIVATRGIVTLIPPQSIPNEARITININVLLFAVGVSMLTGILFGLAPALRASRPDLAGTLKEGGSGSGGSAHGQAMRGGLVVTEIALSVVLLTGASLAIRHFVQLMTTDPGFQPEKTLVMPLNLPPERYTTVAQRNAFAQTLVEKIASLPGVQASSIGLGGMPFGGWTTPFSIDGQPQTHKQIAISAISNGYLRTMGMTLKRGRDFTPEEIQDGIHVALINETAAKLWKAGQDPTGGHLHLDVLARTFTPPMLAAAGLGPDMTVVGVVGDTRNWGLDSATQPAVYIPYTLIAPPVRTLAVRTYGDPMTILKAVRAQVKQMDDNLPLGRPYTVEEIVGFETAQPRFTMALLSAFAVLGLTLAAIGIYCVISYNVTQRVHEIGVRMALGASRGNILRWVLRSALKMAAIGLLIGLAGSFATERVMHSFLSGKTSFDAGLLGTVVLVLAVVALLAAWLPARRAGGLDPVTALRQEA